MPVIYQPLQNNRQNAFYLVRFVVCLAISLDTSFVASDPLTLNAHFLLPATIAHKQTWGSNSWKNSSASSNCRSCLPLKASLWLACWPTYAGDPSYRRWLNFTTLVYNIVWNTKEMCPLQLQVSFTDLPLNKPPLPFLLRTIHFD